MILRFLLLSQPEALAAARMERGAGTAVLDRLAVEVFYSFSRTLEHSPDCLSGFLKKAETLSLLGHSVSLLGL